MSREHYATAPRAQCSAHEEMTRRGGHVPPPSPRQQANWLEPRNGGHVSLLSPLRRKAAIQRKATQRAQWAHAHAARRGGQPGEVKSRPCTQARDAESRCAGSAQGRDPRRRRRARLRSGVEDRPGSAGSKCVAARRGPRAGARTPGGGAARSWSGAKAGRPAGLPDKAIRGTRDWTCKGQCRVATKDKWVGQGCLRGTRYI